MGLGRCGHGCGLSRVILERTGHCAWGLDWWGDGVWWWSKQGFGLVAALEPVMAGDDCRRGSVAVGHCYVGDWELMLYCERRMAMGKVEVNVKYGDNLGDLRDDVKNHKFQ